MNPIRIHPHSLSRSCKSTLANYTQRLLFFLLVSLVLHGLLFEISSWPGKIISKGQKSSHLPIILTLGTSSIDKQSKKNLTITHHPAFTRQTRHHYSHQQTSQIAANDSDPLIALDKMRLPTQSAADNKPKHTVFTHKSTITPPVTTPLLRQNNRAKLPAPNIISTPTPNPAAVAALLRHALQQHFHYPVVALQNNWQGKVILGMLVTADGQVMSAHILRTSGFRVLDRAAKHSANEIGSLPVALPLLAGKSLRFRVPVVYHLE